MPPKTNKWVFSPILEYDWVKSDQTPTLMCTLTVFHDFGNQKCVALDKQAGWTVEKNASGS